MDIVFDIIVLAVVVGVGLVASLCTAWLVDFIAPASF